LLDGSESLFASLSDYGDLQALIGEAEAEGLYLECKAPSASRLNRKMKAELAVSVSGFSNTSGGVIIWGMSTTNHPHGELDVLTQIVPIGPCKRFAQQVRTTIPSLSTPAILNSTTKIIKQRPTDSRGVVLTHIPRHLGDPVQSITDDKFYFRSGDAFVVAPYDMIRRLFAAAESPDLHATIAVNVAAPTDTGGWQIPIVVSNESTAAAEDLAVNLTFLEPFACDVIDRDRFIDLSPLNPGTRIYGMRSKELIYKGFNLIAGSPTVRMKMGKRPKRALHLAIDTYASKMVARRLLVTLHLTKTDLKVTRMEETPLY